MTKITAELTKPLLIDGAMSTALEQLGADTNNSLWTASVLANQPALVKKVHQEYFKAGARLAITDTYQANVPVADIKGTLHASYYDNNWLVMMMKLDRHKDDFDVESVKDAIFNTKCFEPIHLSKYGELYFINGGDNHRVCQAKVLGFETVPCEVTEFVIEK